MSTALASRQLDTTHGRLLAWLDVESRTRPGRTYRVRAWSDRTYTCECPAAAFGRGCRHIRAAKEPLRRLLQQQRIERAIHADHLARVARAGGPDAYERQCRAADVLKAAQDEDLSYWASKQEQTA